MSLTKKEEKALKKFGAQIRAIRQEKGWTLEDAEEQGWPSWQHLQKIEAGQKNVTYLTILRLQDLFGVNLID